MPTSQRSSLSEFIDLLKTKKQTGNDRIVVFAGSAISLAPPSGLPSADALLSDTLNAILENRTLRDFLKRNNLRERIRNTITEASKKRLLPPELFYDAIYEYVGAKVFDTFACLKTGQPNVNHSTLITLLEAGYIDKIITTNFDSLLEQSLDSKGLIGSQTLRKQIWKIHGDISDPDTMVATFRRVGQSLFDERILTTLKNDLDNSHVLFIGYGGTDPDLRPALVKAKMKTVFWVAYNEDEHHAKSNQEPWITIDRNCGGVRWIIGDLHASALAKIQEEIFPYSQKDIGNLSFADFQHSLHLDTNWLQFSDNICVLLQVLYNTAGVSPSQRGIWDMIGDIADELLASSQASAEGGNTLIRDLHAFRAEACLKKGEIVRAKNHLTTILPMRIDDRVQAMALLNAGVILTGPPGDKNVQGAEHFFSEALWIASHLPKREPGRLSLQARCHSNLAVLRVRENRPLDASEHFEAAAKLYKEAGGLLEYIGILIHQARHFLYLRDTEKSLIYFFKAEHELIGFPNHQLNDKLRELEQEIMEAGIDISASRARINASTSDVDWTIETNPPPVSFRKEAPMTANLPIGAIVAKTFRVKRIRTEPILSEMSNPIIDSTVVELDSLYENKAFLGFYTFSNSPPPCEQWTFIVAKDIANAHIFPMWTPLQIKQECICLPYKVRTPSGSIMVVTQMLAAKNNTVVSSKVCWFGFPGINKLFVGFKPGMKARTEELLLAGLDLAA